MSYHLLKIETPEQEDLLTNLNKTFNFKLQCICSNWQAQIRLFKKRIILSFQCVLKWSFQTKIAKKEIDEIM